MSSSVEMDNITKDDSFAGGSSLNTRDHTYDPPPPMGRRPQQSPRSAFSGFVNSFRRDPNSPSKDATSRHPFYDRHGYYHSRRDGSASFEGGDEMEIIDGVPTNWSRHRGSVSGNGGGGGGGRYYDLHAASVKTAHSLLSRELKGRHLQMIAIGGSIGKGFFFFSFFSFNPFVPPFIPVFIFPNPYPSSVFASILRMAHKRWETDFVLCKSKLRCRGSKN